MTDQQFPPSDPESASAVQPENRRVREAQQPEDPFNPRGVEFRGVSPALVKVRVVAILISAAIVVVPLVVIYFWWKWAAIFAVVFLALHIWLLWLVPRQVRAIGYAETDSDLLIRKGIMFKTLTVVPYGRMQYVDVSEGPIARSFGIAEVKLHTASASTDATIPGLPAPEAARLRNQLAERGEAEMAGL